MVKLNTYLRLNYDVSQKNVCWIFFYNLKQLEHTYVRTYVQAVFIYVCTYVHTYMHTYIRMQLRWRYVTRLPYNEWQKVKTAENVFHINLQVKSTVFKWRLKLVSDDSDVTFDGRPFEIRDAKAAKEPICAISGTQYPEHHSFLMHA